MAEHNAAYYKNHRTHIDDAIKHVNGLFAYSYPEQDPMSGAAGDLIVAILLPNGSEIAYSICPEGYIQTPTGDEVTVWSRRHFDG